MQVIQALIQANAVNNVAETHFQTLQISVQREKNVVHLDLRVPNVRPNVGHMIRMVSYAI